MHCEGALIQAAMQPARVNQESHRTPSYLSPPFTGLSSVNSACHSDSQPAFCFAGDFAGDCFAADCAGSRWRCSDRTDFDGDMERWRTLAGDALRDSGRPAEMDVLRVCQKKGLST